MVKGNKFKSPEFLARQQAVLETLAPAAKASAPVSVTQQPAAGRQKPAGARGKQHAAQEVRASTASVSRIKPGTAAGPPRQSPSKARAPAARAAEPQQPTEARSQPLKRKRAAEEPPVGRQQPAATQGPSEKQPTALSRRQRQRGTAQPVLGGLRQEAGASGEQDGMPGRKRKSRRHSAPLSVSQQQPDAMPGGPVKQTRLAQPASQQHPGAEPAAPAKQARQAAQAVEPVSALAAQTSAADAGEQSPRQQGNDGTAQPGRGPRSERHRAPKKAALVTSTAMPAAGECSAHQHLLLHWAARTCQGCVSCQVLAAASLLQPAIFGRRHAA